MLSLFTPKPEERALTFGLKFSAIGCALTLFGLASCSYLIPEDSRPPRYNSVVGERRVPPLNRAVGAAMPDPATGMPTDAGYGSQPPAGAGYGNAPMQALPANPAAMNYGGMPSPQAPNAPIPQANAQPQKGFFERSKGWIFGDDAEIRKTPIPLGRPLPPGASKSPDTTTGSSVTLAMGSSSEYPELETVQEVPPATIAAHEKLTQATAALKIDQARANAAREALANEAASEPTLLDAYRDGQLPVTPQAQATAPIVSPPATTTQGVQAQSEETVEHFDFTTAQEPAEAQATEPPPAPTVNIVRGVQSETIELREPIPPASSGRGYLPDSRYNTNATN
jgi:hypothetical protein